MRRLATFILFISTPMCSGCWVLFGDQIDTLPPICQEARRDSSIIYGEKQEKLSVDELLILQKCGLAVHPNYRLSLAIAKLEEYSVPKILTLLDTDTNQEYQLMLIENLTRLTEADRHRGRMRTDEAVIMDSVDRAISNMNDWLPIKKYAQAEREKLAIFFRQSED